MGARKVVAKANPEGLKKVNAWTLVLRSRGRKKETSLVGNADSRLGQGCAPRMHARTSKLHSDRCGKVPEAMSRTVPHGVAFEFFKCKSRKEESETYDCGRNKIPGVLETSVRFWNHAKDSGTRFQQGSTLVARFWNDADDSDPRIHFNGPILE